MPGSRWVRGQDVSIGFLSSTGPEGYEASTPCWAIIRLPAKRHLNGFSLAANDDLLLVLFRSSLPSSTVKKTQCCQDSI